MHKLSSSGVQHASWSTRASRHQAVQLALIGRVHCCINRFLEPLLSCSSLTQGKRDYHVSDGMITIASLVLDVKVAMQCAAWCYSKR